MRHESVATGQPPYLGWSNPMIEVGWVRGGHAGLPRCSGVHETCVRLRREESRVDHRQLNCTSYAGQSAVMEQSFRRGDNQKQ